MLKCNLQYTFTVLGTVRQEQLIVKCLIITTQATLTYSHTSGSTFPPESRALTAVGVVLNVLLSNPHHKHQPRVERTLTQ